MDRRGFVKVTGAAAAEALLNKKSLASVTSLARRRYAMVGTGHRGTGMWGKDILERYSNEIEFVFALRTESGPRPERSSSGQTARRSLTLTR